MALLKPRYLPNCRQQAKIAAMFFFATVVCVVVVVVFLVGLVVMVVMVVRIVPLLNKRLAGSRFFFYCTLP